MVRHILLCIVIFFPGHSLIMCVTVFFAAAVPTSNTHHYTCRDQTVVTNLQLRSLFVFRCMTCGILHPYIIHNIFLHISSSNMDNLVINLSDHRFSSDQISVLSKGLNCCPTPGDPKPSDLRCDLDSLHWRLRLHSYFKDKEDSHLPPEGGNYHSLDESFHSKCRVASTFNPPGPLALESMIVFNEHNFNNRDVFTATGQNNLTVGEHKALKELQNLSNIKGAIVVQSREQYLKEGLRQLADSKFCTKQ